MDGTGYPRGLFAGDMSVPARLMAIADVFEALTAQDRPYKSAKKLSETMRIMGFMKRDNHLDPDLFDLFVSSGVYRDYAKRYLPAALIDEVDEAGLLAIMPKPFSVPDPDSGGSARSSFCRNTAQSESPRASRIAGPRSTSLLPKSKRS